MGSVYGIAKEIAGYSYRWRPEVFPLATKFRAGAESLLRGGGSHAGLHVTRQVRHDADDALDQHELPPVMHFMFLDRKDHVEAASGGGSPPRRHGNLLRQEIIGKCIEPASPFFPGSAEQLKRLLLGPWRLFFRV